MTVVLDELQFEEFYSDNIVLKAVVIKKIFLEWEAVSSLQD